VNEAAIVAALVALKQCTRRGEQLSDVHLQTLYTCLPLQYQDYLHKALEIRNGKVTDFSSSIQAACSCNTAIYWTGSSSVAAKVAMFYILNYMLGDPSAPVSIASLSLATLKAQEHVKAYPSVAANTGTEERSAMQSLSRIILSNKGGFQKHACLTIFFRGAV
jgi:hypothetical protein